MQNVLIDFDGGCYLLQFSDKNVFILHVRNLSTVHTKENLVCCHIDSFPHVDVSFEYMYWSHDQIQERSLQFVNFEYIPTDIKDNIYDSINMYETPLFSIPSIIHVYLKCNQGSPLLNSWNIILQLYIWSR